MMSYSIVHAVGQARLAELHDQARLDSLARAARRERRATREHAVRRAPRLLAAVGRWAVPERLRLRPSRP